MEGGGWKKMIHAYGKKLGAYKYVVLVIAAGLLLLLWPQSESREEAEVVSSSEELFSVTALEEKLEASLSRIHGAGQVSVILTVESGMENIYATDRAMSGETREEQLVIVSEGSGKETTVTESQKYPTFRGALVICEGGGDPSVKLQITQAVAVLTGLGADRISVCQGN